MKEKKRKSRYDISDWTFTPNFMTDLEITKMYSLLKGHMYMKYKKYDEEIIHRTILQGLRYGSMYDPTKASKLVWFQTILRNVYYQEIDPKYNKRIKHHYSLDYSSPEDEGINENSSIISQVSSMVEPDVEEDNSEKIFDATERVHQIVMSGDYPIMHLKIQNVTSVHISKMFGCSANRIYFLLKKERIKLNEYLKSIGSDIVESLGERLHIQSKMPSKKSRKAEWVKKKEISPTTECVVCKAVYDKSSLVGSYRKTCSDECSIINKRRRETGITPKDSEGRLIKTCAICNKVFVHGKEKGPGTKTCSDECSVEIKRMNIRKSSRKVKDMRELKLDI